MSLPMTGEAGYSHCPAGITGTTCPFYLGSLQASATTSVAVTDTCPDSSGFSAVVTDFDLQLLQAAFGIADDSSLFKAFPPGALFVEGYITVNGDSYTIRSVNTDPVYMQAATSGVFAADIPIDPAAIGLQLPCGSGTSVTSIPFNGPHELRAVAFDERGAATTATLWVGCS